MFLRTIANASSMLWKIHNFLHFLLIRYLRFILILGILEAKTSCCKCYISFPAILTKEHTKKLITYEQKYNFRNINYERTSFPFQVLVLNLSIYASKKTCYR